VVLYALELVIIITLFIKINKLNKRLYIINYQPIITLINIYYIITLFILTNKINKISNNNKLFK